MRRTLNGKRILITGASSGIGKALARTLATAGARLLLTARTAEPLEAAAHEAAETGAEVLPVPADVTLDADRHRLLRTAEERFGGLDVLVNNAGLCSAGHFATSPETILRQLFEVNFFAPAELMRLAVPLLIKGEQPAIVNVASRCGRCALPAFTEYSASKFALCGLSEALRAEFSRFDIDVLVILPGITQTGMKDRFLRNEGRMNYDFSKGMPVERVARAIQRALERNRSETVLGETRWLLLVQKFFPGLVNRLMARRVRQLYADETR